MRLSNLMIITLVGLFCLNGLSFASEIAVPPIAAIVQEAETIVGGMITVDKSQEVVIEVEEVFKGGYDSGRRIVLKMSDSPMGVSLARFLSPYAGQRCIVLGNYSDVDGVLELPWNISTILPYGYNAGTYGEFPSTTYEQCKTFIESILMYQRIGETDKDALIDMLLDDIRSPRTRCAVLCFSDNMVLSALNDRVLKKELQAVFMAEIATPTSADPNGVVEPCVVNNIAYLSPHLPPSICARYLMKISTQRKHPHANYAFTQARAILMSRRMIEKAEVETPIQLQEAIEKKLAPLRVLDANNAMRLFDSPYQRLRNAAGSVVAMALGDDAVPDSSAKDKKAFWQKRIKENIERMSEEDRGRVRRAGVKL